MGVRGRRSMGLGLGPGDIFRSFFLMLDPGVATAILLISPMSSFLGGVLPLPESMGTILLTGELLAFFSAAIRSFTLAIILETVGVVVVYLIVVGERCRFFPKMSQLVGTDACLGQKVEGTGS